MASENRYRAARTHDWSPTPDSTQVTSACRASSMRISCVSPHAHAKIMKINVAQAIDGPGVIAVLTGGDAAADGLKPIPHSPVPTNPHEVPLRNRDGSGFCIEPHPVLARDAVRYVGEPVAIVIAETLAAAMDAAEQVGVFYEPVAAIARSQDALSSGAPPVWDECVSSLSQNTAISTRCAGAASFQISA
jgi:carbon-monoxide dehydrogenase large subunit